MFVTHKPPGKAKTMSVRIYHGEYSVSEQRKFVLVIGCYVRDVLGEDGMTPNADTNLRSDEVRVVAMNRLLKGKARVITANKTEPQHRDFMYHYKMNTRRTGRATFLLLSLRS